MHRTWFSIRWLALATTAALVASACSSSSEPQDLSALTADQTATSQTSTTTSSATTSSTSTTTTTSEPTAPPDRPDLEIPTEWGSELDEIFGRYLLYWDAYDIAKGPPETDPDYLRLQEVAVPALHEDIHQQLVEARDKGEILIDVAGSATDHVVRLPNPTFLGKVEGNEVVMQDCFTDARILQTVDGVIINDKVGRRLHNINMLVVDGEWLVLAVVRAGDDSAGYEECMDTGSFS